MVVLTSFWWGLTLVFDFLRLVFDFLVMVLKYLKGQCTD